MYTRKTDGPHTWNAQFFITTPPVPGMYDYFFDFANLLIAEQVIDEADRLLAQSFQDWLAQVLTATRPPPKGTTSTEPILTARKLTLPIADAVAPAFLHTLPYPIVPTFLTETRESSCQKLLFSATLTRDPSKITALELRDPKYFIVQESRKDGVLDVVMEKFSMPSTLTVQSSL